MEPMTLSLLVMAALVSVTGSVGPRYGPVTGSVDGDHIVVTTDAGVRCQGSLLKMTKDGGLGDLTCDDGSKGSFGWTVWSRGHASGNGYLGGEPLELHFDLD